MVKKIIITFILFAEIIFLQKQNILNKNIVNADCGHLNELCCENNTCVDDNLVCEWAGDNLHVYMCFDKKDYEDFEDQYLSDDKIFCRTSNPKDGITNDPSSEKIYTAIGCIPVTGTSEFVAWILGWAIGIGGGIALMLIIVASFQIMTSSGNPEKIQAGKELLTSAIAGLIMLIFAVFILKVIGVDILKLPGLE